MGKDKNMSCQPFNEMSELERNQLACNLAALILHDEKIDMTSENLSNVLQKSGLNVPNYWPLLMSKALEGQNFEDLLKVSGNNSASNNNNAQQEQVQEEEEPTVEEESEDMDMGDLFG